MNSKSLSLEGTQNPMDDISNKLHDAVDNIMSSFASRRVSLQSISMKSWDSKANVEAYGSQNSKAVKAVTRTTEKVL